MILLNLILSFSAHAISPWSPLPSGLVLCENNLLRYDGPYVLDNPRTQLMEDILARPSLSPTLLIEFMAGHPRLKPFLAEEAYRSAADPGTGHTLGEQLSMALHLFRDQERFYWFGKDTKRLIVIAMLLRDVGRAAGLREFKSSYGHPPTTPAQYYQAGVKEEHAVATLVPRMCQALNLSAYETAVITALVRPNTLASVVEGTLDQATAVMDLKLLGEDHGWRHSEAFMVRMLMYVSRSAAFANLRYGRGLARPPKVPMFVENQAGQLIPISDKFHQLFESIKD